MAPPQNQSLGEIDLTYLSDASLQLSSQLDTRIRILDAHGTVLVDSQGAERGADLTADPLVAQALQGQYASRTGSDGSESAPAMYVALPVLVEGRLVGVVYLSQPLRDVTAVLHDLRTRWLLSTAIALLLSGSRRPAAVGGHRPPSAPPDGRRRGGGPRAARPAGAGPLP